MKVIGINGREYAWNLTRLQRSTQTTKEKDQSTT